MQGLFHAIAVDLVVFAKSGEISSSREWNQPALPGHQAESPGRRIAQQDAGQFGKPCLRPAPLGNTGTDAERDNRTSLRGVQALQPVCGAAEQGVSRHRAGCREREGGSLRVGEASETMP